MNDLNLSNVEQLPEEGWGLRILSPVSDELSYTRTPDNRQNCLLIGKNYQPEPLFNIPKYSKKNDIKIWINQLNRLSQYAFIKFLNLRKNTPVKKIKLQVKTNLKSLEEVLKWYQQIEYLPIPKPVLIQCQIALAEGFTNAVNHAHENLSQDTPIDLEIQVFNHRLEIRIWDYGSPFDLAKKINTLEGI